MDAHTGGAGLRRGDLGINRESSLHRWNSRCGCSVRQTRDRSRRCASRNVSGAQDAPPREPCQGSGSLLRRRYRHRSRRSALQLLAVREFCRRRTVAYRYLDGRIRNDGYVFRLAVFGARWSHCQPKPRRADLLSSRGDRDGWRDKSVEIIADHRPRYFWRGTRASLRWRFFSPTRSSSPGGVVMGLAHVI